MFKTKKKLYAALREVISTAKHDASTYGEPHGGFNAFQFFDEMHLFELYKRLYRHYLEKRLANMATEERDRVMYNYWYDGLSKEERLEEQVKIMRRELHETQRQVEKLSTTV